MTRPHERSRRCFLKSSSVLGLAMAFNPGISNAFADSEFQTIPMEDTMTQTSPSKRGNEHAAGQEAIRPFHVKVPQEELNELRRRI
jgi:hypothetical protein